MTRLSLSRPAPHLAQLARDNFFHCGVLYEDSLSSQAHTRMELEEDVKIYLEDKVIELLNKQTSFSSVQ